MKRYEYKYIMIVGFCGERSNRILNEYGKQGWELVAACNIWFFVCYYFKRELK